MFRYLLLTFFSAGALGAQSASAVITDLTNYNVGETVRIRMQAPARALLSIRYAGERAVVARDIPVSGSSYSDIWKIPADARTGRYEIDVTATNKSVITNAGSFAVHRQRAKVLSVDLDKTFYTAGDPVNPVITVQNVSGQTIENLQVEFEAYTYPWIAPSPDDPPAWKTIVARSLTLQPAEQKTFHVQQAAVVQAEKEPVISYYSVVIRDSTDADRIYDLAFALPAFVSPAGRPLPKQYPFLYLYTHLTDLPKSEAYREFYPAAYVSDAIEFNKTHTMFPVGVQPEFLFTVKAGRVPEGGKLRAQVLDAKGAALETLPIAQSGSAGHKLTVQSEPPGLYKLRVQALDASGNVTEQNQLEFAVNKLPKSLLIFCAHQDDDTAHPGLIRAAVENHIPIHVVYLTSGDAGGCDRYYMHSCDAARAMDFGEVRMEEARASLGHLGVPRENISFLGLPDGGMEQIWFDHPHDNDPYLSVLLATEHAPYREAAIPNLPYSRDAVVKAVEGFIAKLKPDMIVTGHPDERHVDHRTNNWIVVQAMSNLVKQGILSRDTELLVDVVYGAQPGRHAPYHFAKEHLVVSGDAAKLGQEATWYYQSQDGNHQQANLTGLSQLPREEPYPHYRILDWFDHAGWNDKRSGTQ